MGNNKKLVGVKSFTHAGHQIVAQYKEIDGYNIELIEGFSEADNHSQARISAVHNSLHKLVRDGKEINLEIRSDGGTNIPADYDASQPKGRRFLKDALLYPIVNEYAPYLAEELEKSFGKYVDRVADEDFPIPTDIVQEAPSELRAVEGQ